jgi:co-chaperonin GroES (HSP10)
MDTRNDFERLSSCMLNSISELELMPNYMLVKFKNTHSETVGGILTNEGAKASNYSAYSDRVAVVITPPTKLTCVLNKEGTMYHECDIDVEVGDEVFFDPTESLHGQKLFFNGNYEEEYTIARYDSLVLAKRNGEVIMCNGYVLLEEVHETEKVLEFEKDKPIFNQGIVRYLGKPNKRYTTKNKGSKSFRTDDGVDIKIEDKVLLDMPQFTWSLEDWCFAVFDNRKMYRVAKRYMIACVL